MVRSCLVFGLLLWMKALSLIFYRHDLEWVGELREDPWADVRLVCFLNHTSLYEPLFIAFAPTRFLWRVARHGVIPAADKTMKRPLVGRMFRFIARHVVPITRQRDRSWYQVLRKIDPDSMVIIFPEGRMMRRSGLDLDGNPMTVRGGITDIIEAVGDGPMLLAYSGGLHHVQAPGDLLPRLFRTLRLRLEVVGIAEYRDGLSRDRSEDEYRHALRADLERRRDRYRPESGS